MKSLKLLTSPPLPHNLIQNIKDYYKKVNSKKDTHKKKREIRQMAKGIDIWLKFYPEAYKKDFFSTLNIPIITNIAHTAHLFDEKRKKDSVQKEINIFVNKLIESPGFKIFIGRDAFILYDTYRKALEANKERRDDFFFLKFSRPFLFHKSNDENYITLTELIHKNTLSNKSFSPFYSHYSSSLDNTGLFYKRIRKKTLILFKKHNLIRKLNEYKKFKIIDSGMQGGLVLPLVRVLQHEGYQGSFSLFYCFPWLKNIYKGKVQTQNIETFVQLEHDSIRTYNSIKRRAS